VSRTYRILLVAVAAVIAVGGFWKFALAPKRAQAADLATKVATQEAQLAQTQGLIKTYQGAQSAYQSNYANVVRLGKAVPSDDDTRSLVVQLDAAAKRSGVDFDNIDVSSGDAAASATTTTTTASIPGAVNAGTYQAMPFSFSFTGDFHGLGNFLSRLERFVSLKGDTILVNGRLMRVDSISLQPADSGWPGLVAQFNASAFIVPQTAATASSPSTSASTSTSTTPPASTSASASDKPGPAQ
jgi:Tfp pilus assembly protein PilO